MALLDRLRPQPAWKHSDPTTRVSAIEGLPESEQSIFASVAREDESPRVRRAAVSRLLEIDTLAAVARGDADAQVKADASGRLLEIATASDDADRRRRAAEAITEDRQVVQIARTAAHEDVAAAALARVREPRALGSIARHALHESVRLQAVERVTELDELEAVALNSEHKDSGLAAVDRLSDAKVLDAIAERARNKVVARRARAMVRDQESREAEVRAAADARARRHGQILEALDLLPRSKDVTRGRAELLRLHDEWQIAGDATPDAASRYDAIRARASEHFDGLAREEAAAETARATRAAALEARQRLVTAAQALEGSDAAERAEELSAQWSALETTDAPEAADLERQFRTAHTRARDREQARARIEARRGELEALAAEAGQVVEEGDIAVARQRWTDVSRRWRESTEGLALDRELYDRFHTAETRWLVREEALRAQSAREASENHARLRSLCDRATALTGMPEASLKDLDHAVRDLRAAADHLGPLPSAEVQETFGTRVRTLLAQLSPRLRELRETDDWRRWANAGIQEELCKRVEALKTVADPQEAAPQLRDLRRQWKAVSAGPRDEGNALWDRFKTAADEVQAHCDAHFAKVAAEHAQHLAVRQTILEQAENLAQSTDWITTADTLKRLQAEWNASGAVPKDQGAELSRRFRAACDTFFTRRKTDLTERKQVWAGNSQRKEALCAQVETLSQSTDWAAAFAEIKQLQAEWKTVGPVRKNRSEALWKRFRAACDVFFERYGKRHEIEHSQRVHDRESILAALEAIAAPPAAAPSESEALAEAPAEAAAVEATEGEPAPAEASASAPAPADVAPAAPIAARLEELWKRWHDAPGLAPDVMQPLRARFDTALGAVLDAEKDALKGTRFDVSAALARKAALCEEVETLLKGAARPADLAQSSGASLAALLKESLAANTIGGRVNEEAKARAAGDKVRRAQSAWRDIGPVPGEEGRALESRFQKATRRFFEIHPELRHAPPPSHQGQRRDRGPQHHGGGRPDRRPDDRRRN